MKRKLLAEILGGFVGFVLGVLMGGYLGLVLGGTFLGGFDIYEITGIEGYEIAMYVGALIGAVIGSIKGVKLAVKITGKTRKS